MLIMKLPRPSYVHLMTESFKPHRNPNVMEQNELELHVARHIGELGVVIQKGKTN